jgi:hypothetical protein
LLKAFGGKEKRPAAGEKLLALVDGSGGRRGGMLAGLGGRPDWVFAEKE